MKALLLNSHFSSREEIDLKPSEIPMPIPQKGECLIEVHASGVNPSDALGTIGYFSHAQLPRIPGRDFAGIVIDGNPELIGKKVWGTGGAAGLDTNGCHAEYITLPESSLAEIPDNLTLEEAGAQTLPYSTAYYSLVTRAKIQPEEDVLVIGGLGQVGLAGLSICKWKGCRPTALVRADADVARAKELGWNAKTTYDGEYDVILNTIGNVNWQAQMDALKKFGRLVVIAAPEGKREAPFNLFQFYRANQEICGINSVDFNFEENKTFLKDIKQGFESNQLTPLPISKETTFTLASATEAYKTVLRGSKGKRVILSIAKKLAK